MGIQVWPLRAGLEIGLGHDTSSFTRRRNRTEGLGIYHAFSTNQAGGGTSTKPTLIHSFERNGNALIVRFNPMTSLDDDTANLRQATRDSLFNDANITGVKKIILDMENVSVCNSSGLGFLITFSRLAAKKEIMLYVINTPDILKEALAISKLDRTMIIPKDSLKDALQA